jgi:hypothetical protein
MNIETGELIEVKTLEQMRELVEDEKMIEIEGGKLTDKQKSEMCVSLHDHRSAAGKILTAERRKSGLTKNRYRRLKRQGVLK